MWHHNHVVIGQKPSSQEGSMGWRIVTVEQPRVVPPDNVASFAHSPVDVSKFRRKMQHYLFDQEEQSLCEQFPSDQINKSTLT